MGKIYSTLTRPIRTFNIANRAERIISQEKPVPAPQYPSMKKQKKLSHEANPNFLENHYRKDVQLDQRLKNVFVTSTDSQDIITSAKKLRSLPQNRHTPEAFDYFYDPATIPVGKCSLKQVFIFLFEHRNDPITHNSKHIAAQYKLDKEVVDNILKHFKHYVIVQKEEEIEEKGNLMQQIYDKMEKVKNINKRIEEEKKLLEKEK